MCSVSENDRRPRERKYVWAEKCAKMMGERVRIDTKANKIDIVYDTEDRAVS